MLFLNRRDAGQKLAARLLQWRDRPDVLVLGIPRGGVIVAGVVARALHAPLDVWITRKLGAPEEPELAIGAVASDGTLVRDEETIQALRVSEMSIEREKARA